MGDRDMDGDDLIEHFENLDDTKRTEAGRALRRLYARDHALLSTYLECGQMDDYSRYTCFGFGRRGLGFTIEAYELGGDELRFSFLRFGYSFFLDDPYWQPYEAVAALFEDLQCTITVKGYSDENISLSVLHEGMQEFILLKHVRFSRNPRYPPYWIDDVYWIGRGLDPRRKDLDLDVEEKADRLNELLGRDSEQEAFQWATEVGNSDHWIRGTTPHRYFSFSQFCARGAAYEADVRTFLRYLHPAAEQRMCVHRNMFKHAGGVIARAFRRAANDPAYAMCRRRLSSSSKPFEEQ